MRRAAADDDRVAVCGEAPDHLLFHGKEPGLADRRQRRWNERRVGCAEREERADPAPDAGDTLLHRLDVRSFDLQLARSGVQDFPVRILETELLREGPSDPGTTAPE